MQCTLLYTMLAQLLQQRRPVGTMTSPVARQVRTRATLPVRCLLAACFLPFAAAPKKKTCKWEDYVEIVLEECESGRAVPSEAAMKAFKKLKDYVCPSKGLSPEARERMNAAIDKFTNKFPSGAAALMCMCNMCAYLRVSA